MSTTPCPSVTGGEAGIRRALPWRPGASLPAS